MTEEIKYWATLITITAVIIGASMLALSWSRHRADVACTQRGGHLEEVVGGRGGWVCVGVER